MHLLTNILANFYERDIRKLIEEVNLFKNEEDLWRSCGSVKNSAGTTSVTNSYLLKLIIKLLPLSSLVSTWIVPL
jgi:hypothetical protein